MKISSTKFGICVSVGYTLFMTCITYERWPSLMTMKLSEFGDFFAGFFGPLAIFWLILGYFQQGKELRLNTEALKLQATELQNSVQQQRDLVEITRKQHELAEEAKNTERKRLASMEKPKFLVVETKFQSTSGMRTETITVKNEGATVTGVEFKPDENVEWIKPDTLASIEAEKFVDVKFGLSHVVTPNVLNIDISYTDSSGVEGEVTLLWNSRDGGKRVFSKIIERAS